MDNPQKAALYNNPNGLCGFVVERPVQKYCFLFFPYLFLTPLYIAIIYLY